MRGRDPWWRPFLPHGGPIAPPPSPTAAQLGASMDGIQASQANALLKQTWGTTFNFPIALQGAVPGDASRPQAEKLMVNVGPWEEPRALALEAQLQTLASIRLWPRFKFTIDYGIGEATAQMVCTQLPACIFASRLTVRCERYDANLAAFDVPCPLSVWAAPYVPRPVPLPIMTTQLPMPAGGNMSDPIFPPAGATHVMLAGDDDVLANGDQQLFLVASIITGDESSARPQEFVFPANEPPIYPTGFTSTICAYPMYKTNPVIGDGSTFFQVLAIPPQTFELRVWKSDPSYDMNVALTWLRA